MKPIISPHARIRHPEHFEIGEYSIVDGMVFKVGQLIGGLQGKKLAIAKSQSAAIDAYDAQIKSRGTDQGYQVDQARLYGDVDGPLTGPRRRQLRRFLAAVRRHHLSGSVAFTTTEPDDRAFLAAVAGTYGFTYAEAVAHTTLSADWTTSRRPGSAG